MSTTRPSCPIGGLCYIILVTLKSSKPGISFQTRLLSLFGMNIADAASTHAALHFGVASEANPIMDWAYQTSPVFFWITKMALVVGGMVLVVSLATEEQTNKVLSIANVAYLIVMAIHVIGWGSYFLGGAQ